MARILFFAILSLLAGTAVAQSHTQTIRGTVVDEDTQLPLVGATLRLLNSDSLVGTTTNTAGVFRLDNVPIGRVNLQISFVGYEEEVLPALEVNSAKEVVLDISLRESALEMDAIEVTARENRGDALNDLALVSSRSVSAEQTSRFAGGFNDPSKITSNFAGVATSQDGGNEVIIRGNSPKYIQWRLEDAPISNPNHFGDQNAVSGIVNALNNNILSTSDFYTGAFPAEFGDALSGVYDIRMRRGNNEKFEGIFGLGILGTDITLEGPFKKGYRGSFLVNYRYSTIGLANDLGLVEVEGANLNFQDAAFKLWLPTEKMGAFSVFGLQGKSNFMFEDVDPGTWVAPGEDFIQTEIREDYRKKASLLNTGINHVLNLSTKSYLKTSIVYSREGIKDEVYENIPIRDSDTLDRLDFNSNLKKSSYRFSTQYSHKISARHKIDAGIRYNFVNQEMGQSQLDQNGERYHLTDFHEGITSLNSFVNWRFDPDDKFTIVAGLHNTNVLYNKKYTIEPRLALSYGFGTSDQLSFGYGNHSAMESVHNYFTVPLPEGGFALPNRDLDLLRANHFVLGYEKYLNRNLRLNIETYYQGLYNIPVENDPGSSYSTLNEGLELNYVELVNEGTGKNYGIELTLERFLKGDYYFLFNVSVFESKYTALDNVERNTKFNANYLSNLLAGKEFAGLGKKDNQVFSVNLKTFFSGGRYYVPLLRDENGNVAVDVQNGLIYDQSKAYKNKFDDIVNVVFSMSHKWNFNKTTHELYLNIDNITNHRARLTEYYDASKEAGIGNERQVGMIPNLLYRVYF